MILQVLGVAALCVGIGVLVSLFWSIACLTREEVLDAQQRRRDRERDRGGAA